MNNLFNVSDLPIKTTILVSLYDRQKIFQLLNFWIGIVAMPLQVRALPVDFPESLGFNVSCLGKWTLHFFTRLTTPNWPDFEQHNALSGNSKTKIQFRPNVWRGSSSIEVPLD